MGLAKIAALDYSIAETKNQNTASTGPLRMDAARRRMTKPAKASVRIAKAAAEVTALLRSNHALWQGDVEELLRLLPMEPLFDLVHCNLDI